MKIIKKKNGKLTIDGEHTTLIAGPPNKGEDWMKLEGPSAIDINAIRNFVIIYPKKII